MPEGDTLRRAALALRPRLLDRRVERAEPAGLARLKGAVVTGVDSLGKHLLIRFDSGLTLRTHLGMTGSWHVYDRCDRRPTAVPPSALLETEAGVAVLYRAPTVELTRTGRERTGHLGPDLMEPGADVDAAVRRARTLPPETPIGSALLDQRVAAGIGNIHRCELLWASLLSPWTPLGDLDDDLLHDLFRKAGEGLNRGAGPDRHRHAVHGRAGRPCPRCGTRIQARAHVQGELVRTVYWCPRCQAERAAGVRPRPSSERP